MTVIYVSDGVLMMYQIEREMIDSSGKDLTPQIELGNLSQGQLSIHRLIKLLFHQSSTPEASTQPDSKTDFSNIVASELFNLFNAVDESTPQLDTLINNLSLVSRFHHAKLRFCNADKYDTKNAEHEQKLKLVSEPNLFAYKNVSNFEILYSCGQLCAQTKRSATESPKNGSKLASKALTLQLTSEELASLA
jgi:hypothetical protein